MKVAIIGEPPSLDAHWTTASLTYDVTSHLYEPLFTLDERYGAFSGHGRQRFPGQDGMDGFFYALLTKAA